MGEGSAGMRESIGAIGFYVCKHRLPIPSSQNVSAVVDREINRNCVPVKDHLGMRAGEARERPNAGRILAAEGGFSSGTSVAAQIGGGLGLNSCRRYSDTETSARHSF